MSSIHPAKVVTTAFNPFDLDQAYRVWRDWKLEHAPTRLEQLLVEIRNPSHLTPAELLAILDRCAHTNMALYACDPGPEQHKDIPLAIGQSFGLEHLDHNLLADEDAITSLMVNGEGEHPHYIPYTNRPIQWHTDGYYDAPHQQVQALMLHCVHPGAAASPIIPACHPACSTGRASTTVSRVPSSTICAAGARPATNAG